MRARFLASAALVGLASVLGYALADGSGERDRAIGSVAGRSERSQNLGGYNGLIAKLPAVGRLTWRCDQSGRSSTTLTLPRPGDSVFVTVVSDGRRMFNRRQLDPAASPKEEGRLATPLERVRQQSWRIRYHHKPAPVLAAVRIRFGRDRGGDCFVPRATTDVRAIDVSTP